MGPLLFLLFPLLAPPCAHLGAGAATAVSVVRLEAPRTAVRGEPLVLRCLFQLATEGERVYAVKWYKDGREFFRYSPDEPHPLRAFRTDGVDLDERRSNATYVYLRAAQPSSAGKYSCEVTEESPSFMALLDLATVDVVDIDRDATQPEVEGLRSRYRPDEEVVVVCRGPFSRPPSTLTLLLNGKYVNASQTWQMQAQQRADGWARPATKLRARAVAAPDGRLRIRCVASFLDLFLGRDERTAIVAGQRKGTATTGPADADQDLPAVAEPDVEGASTTSSQAPLLLLLLPLLLPLLLDG